MNGKNGVLPESKKQYVGKTADTWKICISDPFDNCEKIYPIQQKKVKALLDHLKQSENVLRVIIFGSSVTKQCHSGSDVDLYVELREESNPISRAFPFVFDLWTNYSTDDRLMREIIRKGVVVYERRDVA